VNPRTPQALPLRPRPGEPRHHPLLNPTALELRNRRQDVELEPPRGRRGVDARAQGDECNPERLEFIQEQYQVTQVAPQPVEPKLVSDLTDVETIASGRGIRELPRLRRLYGRVAGGR
jgi:hypothetical protein